MPALALSVFTLAFLLLSKPYRDVWEGRRPCHSVWGYRSQGCAAELVRHWFCQLRSKETGRVPQLSQMCGHCFGTYGNAELEAQEHVCQSLVFLALKSSLISPSFSAFLQFRTKNALIPLICILMCSFQKGIWELEQGALTEQ